MTAFVELFMDQGTTFRNVINLTDDITNNVVNISGNTVTSQIRQSYYSVSPTANIICQVTDAANGEITMSLSAANTANIRAGHYVFDVLMRDSANLVSRLIEGTLIVTPGVTR